MNRYTARGIAALFVILWAFAHLQGCTVADARTVAHRVTTGTVSGIAVAHPVIKRHSRSVTVVCE